MTLPEKIEAVLEVFAELDKDTARFQEVSGLGCPAGCGRCCFKADIEATVLEFLPFAYHLYKEGTARKWMRKLKLNLSPLCLILDPRRQGKGLCSTYEYRGLICRLFGYAARRDKNGRAQLVTCNLIKTEQKQAYETTVQKIGEGMEVPIMTNYYMRLYAIDMDLGREFFPINTAIRRAIELVLMYFSYRARRSA